MNAHPTARTIAGVALLGAVCGPLLTATASAEPPAVDAFDVGFVDGSCGEGQDAVVALHVRFVDKVQPDGSHHHWIDLSGTLAADTGRVVTLHAARRFTDAADGESSTFAGLMGQFSAAGAGVLTHDSGWSDGALARGRWDEPPQQDLPPAVCEYLFG